MSVKVTEWDPSEYLDNEEAMSSYINEAIKDGDPSLIAAAIGDVARAIGMTQIAKQAKVSREALYRALSDKGNPGFATVLSTLEALNLTLQVVPKEQHRPAAVNKYHHVDVVTQYKSPQEMPARLAGFSINKTPTITATRDIAVTGMRVPFPTATIFTVAKEYVHDPERSFFAVTGKIRRSRIRSQVRSAGASSNIAAIEPSYSDARNAEAFGRFFDE